MRWTIVAKISAYSLLTPILGSCSVYGSVISSLDSRLMSREYDASTHLSHESIPNRYTAILPLAFQAGSNPGSSYPASYMVAALVDPSGPNEMEFLEVSSGLGAGNTSAAATVSPALAEAHEKWLANVAEAAASYGCSPKLIQQLPTETIAEVLKLFALTASEGTCIVLYPISTDPHVNRYSFATGGKVDGIDIFYLSDVGRTRIWNGRAGAK